MGASRARQTFGGRYLHRTIYDKGAALFRSLVKDHALFDGNKRLALASLFVFLASNLVVFYVTKDEAVDFALHVATEDITVREIASWIRRHSVSLTGGMEGIQRRMMKLPLPALAEKNKPLSEVVEASKRYHNERRLPPLRGRLR
ncbi:MAG: type II toxin-antitoxin system death-on-curing family toxin [Dehalococcoidia bacterium]|nr:type II toxin-antitoxin system death-on-curing family toxin [Dehalococcoidia bacterium]